MRRHTPGAPGLSAKGTMVDWEVAKERIKNIYMLTSPVQEQFALQYSLFSMSFFILIFTKSTPLQVPYDISLYLSKFLPA